MPYPEKKLCFYSKFIYMTNQISIRHIEKLSQDERNQLQAVLKRDKLLRELDRKRVIVENNRKVY